MREIENNYRFNYLTRLPQANVAPDHPLWGDDPDAVARVTRVTEGDGDVTTGTLIVYDAHGPWARLFTGA